MIEHLKKHVIDLFVSFNRLNNSISLTTIVVVQASHNPVLMIRCEDGCDLHNSTIQELTIISSHVLPCGKTNMTTIQTVAVDCVTSELVFHHHEQTETNTNPPINTVEN